MEIFDNSLKEGIAEDVMTAMEILKTARPAERKAYMEGLNPDDKFAQQLKVVDEAYNKSKEAGKVPTEISTEVVKPEEVITGAPKA
jgi:hypothetical protein